MNGRAPRRGSALLIGSILSAQAVTGCTPAPQALLAAERNESGEIRLLVAPCPDFKIRGVSVFLDDAAAPEAHWSLIRDSGASTPSQINLFSPPDGYKVNVATLTKIQPSKTYVAKIRGSIGSKGISGRLPFSLEKIDELSPDKVLAGLHGDKVVNRKDFLKSPPSRCKK
ncbi:hypothetical protein [Streptomyces sp. NRRL S-378]|uniref:hypothetical protein n=1 Tax=Streptomyces sp. NRRL S-378 TaxID=1463904 RepID=UPI00131C3BFE|nr:hypothetical protein [Streptomyces sp. NRRL S-378]